MKRTSILLLCLALPVGGAWAGEPPATPPAAPPAADAPKPATPPAESATPVGEEADGPEDLPPGEKGSADNNVSFPVDI